MLLFDTRKFDIQTYVFRPEWRSAIKNGLQPFIKGDLMDFGKAFIELEKNGWYTYYRNWIKWNLDALEKLESRRD
jgi:hypothetical protein